ncbi:P-II family nitrogen regulator [Chloroflexota bacterium]
MSYLVVFVLDSPDLCQDVLDAWETAGVKGITILESTGIGRVRKSGIRDDLSLMPSLSDLFRSTETHNRTLFSIVDDIETAHALVDAIQNTVGDLDEPDSGLLFIVPLVEVYGLKKDSNG